MGMVELILRRDLSADLYEEAMHIKNAGSSLLAIINDVLDFSKIESNKMEIVEADYMLASLLNDICNIIRVRLMERPTVFTVNIDSRLPRSYFGDMARIRQILLNLMVNAVKFTKQGAIAINVYRKKMKTEGVIDLVFDIADTGVGIKEEDLEKLFGNFVQLDTHKTLNSEGTGLGLIISRNLVRLMGGNISVKSVYGEGSTFTVEIPQKISSVVPYAVVDNPEEKSVLIYESTETCVDSLIYSCDSLGLRHKAVYSDEDMIECLSSGLYQFLFVDAAHYKGAAAICAGMSVKITLVMLIVLGDAMLDPNIRTITKPVSTLSIANVLNGMKESDIGGDFTVSRIRFTAPEARVLVVDDIATNLKVAQGLMLPYCMHVDCCLSGAESLKLLEEKRTAAGEEYDLVFMDHMMPGMDGIEALKKIRACGGEYYLDLPVVALTANAITGMKEKFLGEGFNDYLSKPIDTSKLDEILFKWLPKEKMQKDACSPFAEAPSKKAPNECALKIEGVDVGRGIAMCGGTEAAYRDILSIYQKDVADRLFELRSFMGAIEAGSEPDPSALSSFTTQVHALKSASASIGAAVISGAAAALEDAGKKKDPAFIRESLPSFCANLAALRARIADCLAAGSEDGSDAAGAADACGIEADLLLLASALEAADIAAIDGILESLQAKTLSAADKEKVSTLSDCVLVSDFDAAISLIKG
jgi:CheY-like chemotaxis protein